MMAYLRIKRSSQVSAWYSRMQYWELRPGEMLGCKLFGVLMGLLRMLLLGRRVRFWDIGDGRLLVWMKSAWRNMELEVEGQRFQKKISDLYVI